MGPDSHVPCPPTGTVLLLRLHPRRGPALLFHPLCLALSCTIPLPHPLCCHPRPLFFSLWVSTVFHISGKKTGNELMIHVDVDEQHAKMKSTCVFIFNELQPQTEFNKAVQNWKAKWFLPRVNSRGWRGKNFVSPTAKAYATTQKPRGRGGAAPHAARGRRKADREGLRPAHPPTELDSVAAELESAAPPLLLHLLHCRQDPRRPRPQTQTPRCFPLRAPSLHRRSAAGLGAR